MRAKVRDEKLKIFFMIRAIIADESKPLHGGMCNRTGFIFRAVYIPHWNRVRELMPSEVMFVDVLNVN